MLKLETRVNNITLIILLFFATWFFLYVIQSYIICIFYAAILSRLSRPIYNRFKEITSDSITLSSILTVVSVIIVVLIPVIALIFLLGSEISEVSGSLANWLSENQHIDAGISKYARQIPMVASIFPTSAELDVIVHNMVHGLMTHIESSISHILSGSANFILKSIITLFILFYFLIDGLKILERIIFIIPIRKVNKEELFTKFFSVSRATLKGTGVVAMVQGIVGGFALMLAGVPHSLLWGFLIANSSLIPSVGTAIIWIPACIYLFMEGSFFAGIGLLLFCAIILGNLDNVLRPMLIGKNTDLPDLLIFLGTIGGIGIFGISGIIIGPLAAAIFVSLWQMYKTNFKDLLKRVSINEIESSKAN